MDEEKEFEEEIIEICIPSYSGVYVLMLTALRTTCKNVLPPSTDWTLMVRLFWWVRAFYYFIYLTFIHFSLMSNLVWFLIFHILGFMEMDKLVRKPWKFKSTGCDRGHVCVRSGADQGSEQNSCNFCLEVVCLHVWVLVRKETVCVCVCQRRGRHRDHAGAALTSRRVLLFCVCF